jgi:hypothetical protein
MASAACINKAGVPVEFKVATILAAIWALLPIPVITTRPLRAKMARTQASKSSSIRSAKCLMASASVCKTFFAIILILFVIFNLNLC